MAAASFLKEQQYPSRISDTPPQTKKWEVWRFKQGTLSQAISVKHLTGSTVLHENFSANIVHKGQENTKMQIPVPEVLQLSSPLGFGYGFQSYCWGYTNTDRCIKNSQMFICGIVFREFLIEEKQIEEKRILTKWWTKTVKHIPVEKRCPLSNTKHTSKKIKGRVIPG